MPGLCCSRKHQLAPQSCPRLWQRPGRAEDRDSETQARASSVSSVGAGSGVMTRTYCSCMAASSMMRPAEGDAYTCKVCQTVRVHRAASAVTPQSSDSACGRRRQGCGNAVCSTQHSLCNDSRANTAPQRTFRGHGISGGDGARGGRRLRCDGCWVGPHHQLVGRAARCCCTCCAWRQAAAGLQGGHQAWRQCDRASPAVQRQRRHKLHGMAGGPG